MSVVPTTVEALSCRVHKLLCTCEFSIALLSVVLVVVGHFFCGVYESDSKDLLSVSRILDLDCFKGCVGETSERLGAAHKGFRKRIDTILN